MPHLRCLRCNRPLLAYSVSTQTRSGVMGWGPKCAALAGVEIKQEPKPSRPRVQIKSGWRHAMADPRQLDWLTEAVAA